MPPKTTTKAAAPANVTIHLVTVGTTPGNGPDVVDALIEELRPDKPRRVIVLATGDSLDNAERIRKGLRLGASTFAVHPIASAHSLDAAFEATSELIRNLLAEGVQPSSIILHYTAGTKVMSAGAVLAALRYEIQSFRYLYSPGRGQKSEAIATSPTVILADQRIRMAATMVQELRFRSAADMLKATVQCDTSGVVGRHAAGLRALALAYLEWDNFRASEFLRLYEEAIPHFAEVPALSPLRITDTHAAALRRISESERAAKSAYPEELLLDLVNNAIRRLAERRPDDAMIRLYRAMELYAQEVLLSDHGIRTEDVEIRKVPPRYRAAFESERRLDDATIKLGLRKSFELLAVLGNAVGVAFQQHEEVQKGLRERRHLVLGHGTQPGTIAQALHLLEGVFDLLRVRIKDPVAQARRQQFPWIDSEDVLARLGRQRSAEDPVIVTEEKPRKRRG
jgi:CRISPR-associated protein (TIGR02710 family)